MYNYSSLWALSLAKSVPAVLLAQVPIRVRPMSVLITVGSLAPTLVNCQCLNVGCIQGTLGVAQVARMIGKC